MAVVIGADLKLRPDRIQQDAREAGHIIERTLGGSFRAVDRVAALPFQTVSRLAGVLPNILGKLTSVDTLLRGTILAHVGQRVFDHFDNALKRGGELEVQLNALAGVTGKYRSEVEDLVADVNNASKGLLDFSTAARMVNQAQLLGIDAESTRRIVELTSALVVAKGEAGNAEQAIGQVLKGASGRFGFDELRRVGINVSERDVVGLSAEQATAKILSETLRQLEQQSKQLNVSGREVFFTYTAIFGNIQDIRDELARVTVQSRTLGDVVRYLEQVTGGIARTLREGDADKAIDAILTKLIEVAGALAVDLGEAIAVGVGRGIRKGLELFGFDLEDILGRDSARRVNDFLDRQFFGGGNAVFAETQQRLSEFRGVVTPDDREAQRQQAVNRRRQLEEIEAAIGFAGGQGGTAAGRDRFRDELAGTTRGEGGRLLTMAERRERARRQLEEQRRALREDLGDITPQQRPGRDDDELRRRRATIVDAIAFGTGTALEPSSSAARDLFRGAVGDVGDRDPDGRRLTPAERRERAADRLRLEQDRLEREIGTLDAGEQAQREVREQIGTDEDDSLWQRGGKALVTGLEEAIGGTVTDQLKAAIDEGFGAAMSEVSSQLMDLGGALLEDAKEAGGTLITSLVEAVAAIDWMGIGESIAGGILSRLSDGPRRTVVGAIVDGAKTAGRIGRVAGDVGNDRTGGYGSEALGARLVEQLQPDAAKELPPTDFLEYVLREQQLPLHERPGYGRTREKVSEGLGIEPEEVGRRFNAVESVEEATDQLGSLPDAVDALAEVLRRSITKIGTASA